MAVCKILRISRERSSFWGTALFREDLYKSGITRRCINSSIKADDILNVSLILLFAVSTPLSCQEFCQLYFSSFSDFHRTENPMNEDRSKSTAGLALSKVSSVST